MVRIDHAVADPQQRVFAGQQISVTLLEPPDKLLDPDPADLRIVYHDPWMLVLDKPPGLIAHPTGDFQSGTLSNVLQHWLDETCGVRGILRPGIVHRLDRQTSGAIAVALDHIAHRELAGAFESSRVAKSYVALVEGRLASDRGDLRWPIGRSRQGSRVLMSARGDAVDARPARTKFAVLARFRDHTLVRAVPLTGRNHQIRVHFAHLGHPLVGDEFYDRNGRFKRIPRLEDADVADAGIETGLPIRRHALHAERLALPHPITGAWLQFHAPWPEDLRITLRALMQNA